MVDTEKIFILFLFLQQINPFKFIYLDTFFLQQICYIYLIQNLLYYGGRTIANSYGQNIPLIEFDIESLLDNDAGIHVTNVHRQLPNFVCSSEVADRRKTLQYSEKRVEAASKTRHVVQLNRPVTQFYTCFSGKFIY